MSSAAYQSAVAHFNAGRSELAGDLLSEILASDPNHVGALHLAGLLAHQHGQQQRAVAFITKAVEIEPSSQMYCNLALITLAQGATADAIEHCHQALLLDPEQTDAYYNMGLAQQSAGDFLAAEQSYRKVLEKLPQHVQTLNNIGVVQEALQGSSEAVVSYRRALECQPDFAMAHYNLAISQESLGDYDAAAASYRRTIGLQPSNAKAHNNLGVTLKKLRRHTEAAECYRKAIALAPGFADAHQNLGDVLAVLGHLDEAIESHRAAIRLQWGKKPLKDTPNVVINVASARLALLDARQLLNQAGIPFFPYAGTLLGLVRDGDILPHDKDMDIGLPWEIDRGAALEALTGDGVFVCLGEERLSEQEKQWYINLYHADTRVGLDLFFFKPDGEFYLAGIHSRQQPMLSRPRRFELATMQWQGVDWSIPDPAENLLVELYGPDWRTPDPDFDTVVSSFCKTPASFPGRRCHGYSRLYTRLRGGQMRKAYAYCRQLLQLHPDDPFLEDLLAQSDTVTVPRGTALF